MTKAELREEFETQNKVLDTKFKNFEEKLDAKFNAYQADLRTHGANVDIRVEKSIDRTVVTVCTIAWLTGILGVFAQVTPIVIQILQYMHKN